MQKIETFSGTVTLGTTATRLVAFGNTGTISHYKSHTDIINGSIASFLQSCGVDAVYEVRSDADAANEWLWVEGVPLLFVKAAASNGYFLFRHPGTAINTFAANVNLFNAYNGTTYKFRLGFAGKAKNAWILRIGLYNATAFVAAYCMIFYHAKSVADGTEARLLSGLPANVTNGCMPAVYSVKLTNGTHVTSVDELSLEGAPMQVWGGNNTIFKTFIGTEYPLLPVSCGPFVVNGVYHFLGGVGLPQGTLCTVDAQTETTIGGRSFLVTSIDATTTSYYNAGLIETT